MRNDATRALTGAARRVQRAPILRRADYLLTQASWLSGATEYQTL
jgi:hypothetical protein